MGKPIYIQIILLAGLILAGVILVSCRFVGSGRDAAPSDSPAEMGTATPPPQVILPPTLAATKVPATAEAAANVAETAVPDSTKERDQSPVGIGVLGGSNSDEYRGDDNRGGEYAETTLGWVEQLVKSRDLNFGAWGEWGEPRRTGFEYNWARSGATTRSMIESGQHTGLAQQIADGKVSYALLFIGINDFSPLNGTYTAVYDGSMDDAALQAKVNQMTADITTAVDTLLAAGEVKMAVVTIADPAVLPAFRAPFPDAVKRQRVTDAINVINENILEMAAAREIVVIDIDKIYSDLVAQLDADGNLNIGGEKVAFYSRGNEPHSGQLNDQTGHLGTALSGYIANVLFIEPFNAAYGLDIRPLTEQEILQNAGIR